MPFPENSNSGLDGVDLEKTLVGIGGRNSAYLTLIYAVMGI